ncbi:hypothetical protein AB0D33_03280 [Streptomyces sp. NPDC048404]
MNRRSVTRFPEAPGTAGPYRIRSGARTGHDPRRIGGDTHRTGHVR